MKKPKYNSPEAAAKALKRGLRWMQPDQRDTRPSRKRSAGDTPPSHIKDKLSIVTKDPAP